MTKILAKIFIVSLFLYSCIFSFSLVFGAFSRGLTFPNVITILLFLPVVYYFVREISWQTRRVTGGFSLLPFLTQKNPSFILTLILFAVSLSLTFLKNSGIFI